MKKPYRLVSCSLLALFLTIGSSAMATAETPAMDHSGHGQAQQANEGIQAEGVLHAINQEKHTLNITHGAITALSWPAMRMDFAVQPTVDLTALKPGQKVRFYLEKSGEYDYVVTKIMPMP